RQIEMGLGLVLISHDVAVVRKVTDRIVVLDGGVVVEEGPSALVSTYPQTSTAQRLVQEAPRLGIAPAELSPAGQPESEKSTERKT
ncbi:MAG: hypothetical protein M3R66_14805, partial [Actinomycetota bacterium]|nr:hypothetical protein [Actinomycetota bacterium]